jgi:hypothetical protein
MGPDCFPLVSLPQVEVSGYFICTHFSGTHLLFGVQDFDDINHMAVSSLTCSCEFLSFKNNLQGLEVGLKW